MSNDNTGLFTVLGIAGVGLLLLGGSKATSKKKYKKSRMSAKTKKKYISKYQNKKITYPDRDTFIFETEHFDKDGKMYSVKLQAQVPKNSKDFWDMYAKKGREVFAKSNDSWNRDGYKIKKGQRLKLITWGGSNPVYFPTKKDFKKHIELYGKMT